MARLAKILDRDGRRIPYDPARVVSSILDAVRAAGHHDESLADKLAPMVEFGLTRYYGAIPTVDDVAHCVEQSLRSVTDSPAIAEAYVSRRRQRERLREVATREGGTSSPTGAGPSVAGDSLAGWNRGRIEAALVRERDLTLDDARAIAKTVEARILRAGLTHTSTALIRAMVDAELVERGLLTPDSAPSAFVIPAFDVQQAIFPLTDQPTGGWCETPRELENRMFGAVLRQYSLTMIHAGDVARAHLAGRVDLACLHTPARAASASFHCGRVLVDGAGIGLPLDFPDACESASDAAARISRMAWALGGLVAGAVTLQRFDTALAQFPECDEPEFVPAVMDRLAAVSSAHAGEVGADSEPGLWLVFDALAGETHVPGSLTLIRAAISWLRDHGGDRGRSIGIRIRVGSASADDRAATVILEQSVALALGGHPVVWEFARRTGPAAASSGLFGDPTDTVATVSLVPSVATINLMAPFPLAASPDFAVSEDRVYSSLDELLVLAARGVSQRSDFVRRFTLRRREAETGLGARLAIQALRYASASRVSLSGLANAAALLTSSDSPEEVARASQRLASWLHFRLRDTAQRVGVAAELSGNTARAATLRFGSLAQEGVDALVATRAPVGLGGFGLPVTGDRTLEWRLAEEASLHSLADDAVAVLDPSIERLNLASIVSFIAAASESMRLGAMQLAVSLKRCGACGAANPSDASACRSCGAQQFRPMPTQQGLFDLAI